MAPLDARRLAEPARGRTASSSGPVASDSAPGPERAIRRPQYSQPALSGVITCVPGAPAVDAAGRWKVPAVTCPASRGAPLVASNASTSCTVGIASAQSRREATMAPAALAKMTASTGPPPRATSDTKLRQRRHRRPDRRRPRPGPGRRASRSPAVATRTPSPPSLTIASSDPRSEAHPRPARGRRCRPRPRTRGGCRWRRSPGRWLRRSRASRPPRSARRSAGSRGRSPCAASACEPRAWRARLHPEPARKARA